LGDWGWGFASPNPQSPIPKKYQGNIPYVNKTKYIKINMKLKYIINY
jgi:hypothetical protein